MVTYGITYTGETTLKAGQTVKFDYCCASYSTSTSSGKNAILMVQKPDGAVEVLDYQYAYGTSISKYAIIAGSCEYKLTAGGTYTFGTCFINNNTTYAGDKEALETAINGSTISPTVDKVLEITCDDSECYADKFAATIVHRITSSTVNAESLQWQESTDKGNTWTDIEDATEETFVLGVWTGASADDEATATANAKAVIPAYDRYLRCVAEGAIGDTISNVLHVTHEEGNGTPTVT